MQEGASQTLLRGQNQQPEVDWYTVHSDEEVCTYLCRAQCGNKQSALCVSCENSCYTAQLCLGQGDDCHVDKACSIHAFNLAVVKGNQDLEYVKPWTYCKMSGDVMCGKCRSCVDSKCHYTMGGDQCSGPWGDCCATRCLGKAPTPFR